MLTDSRGMEVRFAVVAPTHSPFTAQVNDGMAHLEYSSKSIPKGAWEGDWV